MQFSSVTLSHFNGLVSQNGNPLRRKSWEMIVTDSYNSYSANPLEDSGCRAG